MTPPELDRGQFGDIDPIDPNTIRLTLTEYYDTEYWGSTEFRWWCADENGDCTNGYIWVANELDGATRWDQCNHLRHGAACKNPDGSQCLSGWCEDYVCKAPRQTYVVSAPRPPSPLPPVAPPPMPMIPGIDENFSPPPFPPPYPDFLNNRGLEVHIGYKDTEPD